MPNGKVIFGYGIEHVNNSVRHLTCSFMRFTFDNLPKMKYWTGVWSLSVQDGNNQINDVLDCISSSPNLDLTRSPCQIRVCLPIRLSWCEWLRVMMMMMRESSVFRARSFSSNVPVTTWENQWFWRSFPYRSDQVQLSLLFIFLFFYFFIFLVDYNTR